MGENQGESSTMPDRDTALESARAHVKVVRDFLYHLLTFVLVNGLLVIIDRRGGTEANAVAGLDWAFWVILFWGFGLGGHAIYAFFGDARAQRLSTRLSGD
jgi:hypothetical protein